MFCNQCGHSIPNHEPNCPYCGARVNSAVDLPIAAQDPAAASPGYEEEIYNDEDWYGREGEPASPDSLPDNVLMESDADYVYYDSDHYYGTDGSEQDVGPQRDEWSDEYADLFVEPKAMKRRRLPAIIISVVLVVVVGVIAFYFLKNHPTSESQVDQLIQAITDQDEGKILSLFKLNEPSNDPDGDFGDFPEVNKTNLKPFFNLLKEDEYRASILTELKAGRDSDVLILPAASEGGEGVRLNAYGIKLVTDTAPVTITSPVLAEEINQTSPGEVELMPLYPGDYSFNFAYPKDGSTQSVTHEMRLTWNDDNVSNGFYVLNTSGDVVQVRLNRNYAAAAVLIDGKPLGQTVGEIMQEGGLLGPYAKGTTVTLVLVVNGDTLRSEPVSLTADDQELNFTFPEAEVANTDRRDAEVYLDGVFSGLLSDYEDTGFIIGKKGNGVKYEVLVDGENVQVSAPSSPTETLPTTTTQPSEDATESTTSTSTTSAPPTSTTSSPQETPPATTTTGSPAPPVTTTTQAPQPEPPGPSSSRYSAGEISAAEQGNMSEKMKMDILASIGSFIRQDAEAAKTYNSGVYTTLVNPQLARQQSWLQELEDSGTLHTFVPVQSAIWNNSWRFSVGSDGVLYAKVTQTYYYKITTVKDGVTTRTDEPHGDAWTHSLYFSEAKGTWLIYENTEASGSSDDVDRFGY